jgi:anti-anti-sigma regulatory factor
MLKIDPAETWNGHTKIRLEGRLIGPWVEELRRACEQVLATGARVALDLADVSFLDQSGVELIQSLRQRNVALLSCSAFIAEQLRGWEYR